MPVIVTVILGGMLLAVLLVGALATRDRTMQRILEYTLYAVVVVMAVALGIFLASS